MMRVIVNPTLCENNEVCIGLVPEVFQLDGDDLVVIDENPPESLRTKILDAVRQCPKQAISLEEE